ncbi:MAG: hypothetical protein ACK415_11630, partial [Thermodesulfovibrionales bacterium]
GQYTDRAVAGLTMTIPLLDTRERRELKKKNTELEAQIRAKAVSAFSRYQRAIQEIKQINSDLNRGQAYLLWLKQRVDAGIDYQKDYYKAETRHYETKAQLTNAIGKCNEARLELLSLIKPDSRHELQKKLDTFGGCHE